MKMMVSLLLADDGSISSNEKQKLCIDLNSSPVFLASRATNKI